jgi:hypothetical protein
VDSPLPQDIRIGDADREDALRALGEHFSAGRLDVDEYGERTAKATTARTRRELVAVFADLPGPHPRFERPAPSNFPVTAPDPAASLLTKWWRQRSLSTLLAVAAMGALGIGAVVVFIESHAKVVLGFPILLLIVYGRVWGMGRNREDRRRRRRDRWR